MSLTPIFIAGSSAGLQTDKKPFLLNDQAFPALENAFVWRERVKKREGLKLAGRLRRTMSAIVLTQTDGSGTYVNVDILSSIRVTEPNAEIISGITTIRIDPGGPNQTIYRDTVTPGVLTYISGTYTISAGAINYAFGIVVLNFTVSPPALTNVNADVDYYPGLPVMGIWQREIVGINDEQTIFWDTKYAYKIGAGIFSEFIPGTTWAGTDSDFFYVANYRGSTPQSRLFFATNFVNDAADPIRYTDGVTWTDFAPLVSSTDKLYQARILIPYYGRLVALNVWEGSTAGGYAAAVNIYNRCRFCQIGSPIEVDAWRSDQFGKGGFIDAPVNEEIISATFFKNTLIVGFERSTWQLRYVGEYGLPFIWERVSSDFGTESTFSAVLFDNGVLSVGDRAILSAGATDVNRIDSVIPDLVFNIQNTGLKRVHGIRDFQNELVYWCYPDSQMTGTYPQKTLVYNYRNNTFANFRNSVTCFGLLQLIEGAVSWDSLDVFWDNEQVTWDDPAAQSRFPLIVCGNQQGFVHYYSYTTQDEPSLFIRNVDLSVSPNVLTIPSHNLQDGETIYLTGLLFTAAPPVSLNDRIFRATVIDKDKISISTWNFTTQFYSDTPVQSAGFYIGQGQVTLFPKLEIQTKDFNPYQSQGGQLKLAYVDFLTDCTPEGVISVNLFINSSLGINGNLLVGNKLNETFLTSPYYPGPTPAQPISDYAWHRFFATATGQYIRIQITYNDDLMNTLSTHRNDFVLNAMALYVRPGGRNVF